MKRRDFLRNLLVSSTLLPASAFGQRRSTDPKAKANILFIAIDDLKPILGCYGNSLVQSPAIDAIASQGTVFSNNHCQWAVCGPSRASIMTSLMPEETGVQGFKAMRYLLPDVITIPQHFRANGYETAACGKINDPRCVGDLDPDEPSSRTLNGREKDDVLSWSIPYLSPPNGGYRSPDDRSNEGPDLPDFEFTDGKICEQGLELMRQVGKNDKPFFLAVGFKKPHVPWISPKKYWDYYEREDFHIEEFQVLPLNGTKEAWRKNGTEVHGKSDTPEFPTPIPEAKQKELIHSYYACVSFIDAQVGRLMDELKRLGKADNTVVVVWGDHGYHLGDHAQWAKHTKMEQATRSPLIISSPDIQKPVSVIQSPTGFIDVFPTLCDLVGLPIPEQPLDADTRTGRPLKGVSLVPIMNGTLNSVRTGIINRHGNAYAIRTERYRYIEFISKGQVVSLDLYDYHEDPNETINLAVDQQYAPLIRELAMLLREQPESAGCYDLIATSAPEALNGQLNALIQDTNTKFQRM